MLCLGLMSGTSLDGIDAAIIDTDGEKIFNFGKTLYKAYDKKFQQKLKLLISGIECDWLAIEKELTELHASVVQELLFNANLTTKDISIIGFHGQTIIHRPQENITWQIGNGALLAELTRINVINDFRRRDMAAGGQGAPLVPIFHQAITTNEAKPCAILNLGGVSNITYIAEDDSMLAFDCGPANAIINDACLKYFDREFDWDGSIAAHGHVNYDIINRWIQNPYFKLPAPKSIDRNEFKVLVDDLEIQQNCEYDNISTLTKFVAEAICFGVTSTLPSLPRTIYVAGGGVKNDTLMNFIQESLPKSVQLKNIKEKGLDPDFLEAQAFAYLAARCSKRLTITYPSTTGNHRALSGGAFHYY